jgi:hypothetical protein
MKTPEELAKQIVDTYVSGYAVNNTPRLTDAIACAIQEAEARGEERGITKAFSFFSTETRSFGGKSAAEALRSGTSWNTVRATLFRVFGLDAHEYKEGAEQ